MAIKERGKEKPAYQVGVVAIPAFADEEIGEDDEYDNPYNDVNVGENFLQMHASHVPANIDN
jgi:cleavage and polyadenylation specificity factor subunit 6/7